MGSEGEKYIFNTIINKNGENFWTSSMEVPNRQCLLFVMEGVEIGEGMNMWPATSDLIRSDANDDEICRRRRSSLSLVSLHDNMTDMHVTADVMMVRHKATY